MQRSCQRSRGAILAAALVCLLLVLLYLGVVTRAMVLRHAAMRSHERQVQCFWLAESALARAAAQCRADPAYAGETWRVPLGQQGPSLNGVAVIRVEAIPELSGQKRVLVEALWPDDPIQRVRRQMEQTIPVP